MMHHGHIERAYVMKFFVSGKVGDDQVTKTVMETLKKAGHEITFDWTTINHLRPYDENSVASREAAVSESCGVKNADVLVIVPHDIGVGMYVELGIAIGVGIPIRVVSSGESRTMFFHHPLVKKVNNIEEVIAEFS
jgi:hypothetical protein